MTSKTTASEAARRVLQCADIFRGGCGNAGPAVAGLGMSRDPVDCEDCVRLFIREIQKAVQNV